MTSMTSWTARVEWTRPEEPNGADLGGWLDSLAGHSPEISINCDTKDADGQIILKLSLRLEADNLRQATGTALTLIEEATGDKAAGVEILTTAEHDRRAEESSIPDLIGYAEIADLAGVSRQRARRLAYVPGFPAAVIETKAGPLRMKSQVVEWLTNCERRTGRPASATGRVPSPRDGGSGTASTWQ